MSRVSRKIRGVPLKTGFLRCSDLFKEVQMANNRLGVMAKIYPKEDGDETFATADSETQLRLTEYDDVKKFKFHKVFTKDDDVHHMFNYIDHLSSSILEGEDSGVIVYGGKGTKKSDLLFGNENTKGLVDLYIDHIATIVNKKKLNGYLSLSLVSIDDIDVPRDLLNPQGPVILKLKFNRDIFDNKQQIYRSELNDISLLTKMKVNNSEQVHSYILSLIESNQLKSKNVSYIVTLHWDGDNNDFDFHGRLILCKLVSSDFMKPAGNVDKMKSAFHDTMASLLKNKLVSYQQSYLTYILKDILCLGVRCIIIGCINEGLKYTLNTTKTISFIGDINLDYNLGYPIKRVISKQYESYLVDLNKLYYSLVNRNTLLKHHIGVCLDDPNILRSKKDHEKFNHEIYLKKKAWKSEKEQIEFEIKQLNDKIKDFIDFYERCQKSITAINKNTEYIDEELERRQKAKNEDEKYFVPSRKEIEAITSQRDKLLLKREEYQLRNEETLNTLSHYRNKFQDFDESTGKKTYSSATTKNKQIVKPN